MTTNLYREKTINFLKKLDDDELEMLFIGNLPMTSEEKEEEEKEDLETWSICFSNCIELFTGNILDFDWDFSLLRQCQRDLKRKTNKQKVRHYFGVAGDNGWQVAHRNWKRLVHEKDGYICQHCGTNKNLHAHHIKSRSEFPELQFSVANGITLCKRCHNEIHGGALCHASH